MRVFEYYIWTNCIVKAIRITKIVLHLSVKGGDLNETHFITF